MRILVTGAGGAIGGHLVGRLLADGHAVRAVDRKRGHDWYQTHPAAENYEVDLRDPTVCHQLIEDRDHVYQLAAEMGGMGYISTHRVETLRNTAPVTLNMFNAALDTQVPITYASSACIYPLHLQDTEKVALAETDAWPARPEPAYGDEKLFGEILAHWYRHEGGLPATVARLHNVYGTHSTWDGGREKFPAAACRRAAQAILDASHQVEVWGDGHQTRSYMHVDDCVEGLTRLAAADLAEPINLGSEELVSCHQVYDMLEDITGVELERVSVDGPEGVRGRCSDNALCRELLGWEPQVSLRDGLADLYPWVEQQVRQAQS